MEVSVLTPRWIRVNDESSLIMSVYSSVVLRTLLGG